MCTCVYLLTERDEHMDNMPHTVRIPLVGVTRVDMEFGCLFNEYISGSIIIKDMHCLVIRYNISTLTGLALSPLSREYCYGRLLFERLFAGGDHG